LPQLTVGALIAAIFIVDLALTIYPRRIVTFMQFFAYISIFLTIGALLLGLRHWNALMGNGPGYDTYLQSRLLVLPADPAPMEKIGRRETGDGRRGKNEKEKKIGNREPEDGSRVPGLGSRGKDKRASVQAGKRAGEKIKIGGRETGDGRRVPGLGERMKGKLIPPSKAMPAGANQKSAAGFFFSVLGAGFLFTLLSGVTILWSSVRLATKMRLIEFQIPATAGALLIVAGSVFVALFLFARISPARWYYTENSLLRMVGRNEAGERRLNICIETPAPDYLCRKALARSYREKNKIKEALALYMEVLKERPDFPDVRLDLGDFYYNGGNYWRAADQYRKFLSYRPAATEVREKLSKCLVYIGNLEYGHRNYYKAVKSYKEALQTLERNQNDPVLQYKTGDACYRLGRIGGALVHLSASADQQPHDFSLQIRVGQLYETQGSFVRALYYYKRAIDAKPDRTMSYIYVGNVYRDRIKDRAKAAEWYQKGIDANPVDDAAPAAREALESLK
jgi:tetratricopeptide (TPR) repeat protein